MTPDRPPRSLRSAASSSASSSASSYSKPVTKTRIDKHFIERIMEEWNNPEGRVKLFVIANIVAFGMLILGVIVLVLVMMGYFP